MLEIECGHAVQAEETPAMADAGKAAQEAVLRAGGLSPPASPDPNAKESLIGVPVPFTRRTILEE
jgi:hypothetical protein